MANPEYSIHLDKVSQKVVSNTTHINQLLQGAIISSNLSTNEFNLNLNSIENSKLKTDFDRPTAEEIDNLFKKLRQRPKPLPKPLLKKSSQTFILPDISNKDDAHSTPRKHCDPNEIVASIRHNQQLMQGITNERLDAVDLENLAVKQKKFNEHLQNNIKNYEDVYENLQKNTENTIIGNQSCPIDESFNEAVKQLSKAMTNVTFFKSNEVLPEILEEQNQVQLLPLGACLDDIIEEIRRNEGLDL